MIADCAGTHPTFLIVIFVLDTSGNTSSTTTFGFSANKCGTSCTTCSVTAVMTAVTATATKESLGNDGFVKVVDMTRVTEGLYRNEVDTLLFHAVANDTEDGPHKSVDQIVMLLGAKSPRSA